MPRPLAVIASVSSLPFTDAPGTLSDASLPLLFYSVETVENEIHVSKALALDTVRLP